MRAGDLPLRIHYGEHEPAYSALSRFALRHQLASISELATQFVGLPKNFASAVWAGHHVDLVADIVAVPEQVLRRNTFLDVRNAAADVYDPFHKRLATLSVKWGRICCACLADDLEARPGEEIVRPYRRYWWDLSVFRNCPIHHVQLTSKCPSCAATLIKETPSPRFCRCGFNLASRLLTRIADNQLPDDTYFHKRLTGRITSPNPAYDRMPLDLLAALKGTRKGTSAKRLPNDTAKLYNTDAGAAPEIDPQQEVTLISAEIHAQGRRIDEINAEIEGRIPSPNVNHDSYKKLLNECRNRLPRLDDLTTKTRLLISTVSPSAQSQEAGRTKINGTARTIAPLTEEYASKVYDQIFAAALELKDENKKFIELLIQLANILSTAAEKCASRVE